MLTIRQYWRIIKTTKEESLLVGPILTYKDFILYSGDSRNVAEMCEFVRSHLRFAEDTPFNIYHDCSTYYRPDGSKGTHAHFIDIIKAVNNLDLMLEKLLEGRPHKVQVWLYHLQDDISTIDELYDMFPQVNPPKNIVVRLAGDYR